jgi:hypothetical protein
MLPLSPHPPSEKRVRFDPIVTVAMLPMEQRFDARKARIGLWKPGPPHDEIWDGDVLDFREVELTPEEFKQFMKRSSKRTSVPRTFQKFLAAATEKLSTGRMGGVDIVGARARLSEDFDEDDRDEALQGIDASSRDESSGGKNVVRVTYFNFDTGTIPPARSPSTLLAEAAKVPERVEPVPPPERIPAAERTGHITPPTYQPKVTRFIPSPPSEKSPSERKISVGENRVSTPPLPNGDRISSSADSREQTPPPIEKSPSRQYALSIESKHSKADEILGSDSTKSSWSTESIDLKDKRLSLITDFSETSKNGTSSIASEASYASQEKRPYSPAVNSAFASKEKKSPSINDFSKNNQALLVVNSLKQIDPVLAMMILLPLIFLLMVHRYLFRVTPFRIVAIAVVIGGSYVGLIANQDKIKTALSMDKIGKGS